MLDGVAKWKYVDEDSDEEQSGEESGADGQDVDEKPVSGYESFTLTERLLTPLSRRRLRLNQSRSRSRGGTEPEPMDEDTPKPKRKKSSPHLHGPTVEKPSHPRQRRIHQ